MPGSMVDAEDDRLMREVEQQIGPFVELGVTGLRRNAGYVDEEFLPQLRGRKAVQVYREMSDNDPIVGALIFAITQLMRNVDWQVMPAGNSKEDNEAAKLLETCKDDMSSSWGDFICEAMTSQIYGWSWHEIVYKRRMGPWQKDGRHRSKYSDGLIGWRKMPIRAQETLQRWAFDEHGDVSGMVQMAPPDYQQRLIPIERSLLFRWGNHKNNPEGRSMLRNAYRPWFYKKRLEEFEAIGVERDLAGLPKVTVPMSYLKAKPNTEEGRMVESLRKMVRSIRRNEQEGLIFPKQVDEDTKEDRFGFELLGSGGARQFSTDPLISRYAQWILMTVLADWIIVGHQETGTYNMHVDKTGIFKTALNGTTKGLGDVINRHAVPRLFAANGWRPDRLPFFIPSDIDVPDLTQLAQFLGATSQLGFVWGPDADMDNWLRRIAGMPPLSEDDYRKRRKEARKEEASRWNEEQLRYLTSRSELAAAMAQQEQDAAGIPAPEDAQAAQAAQQQQDSGAQQQQLASQTASQQGEQHEMSMIQAANGNKPSAGSKK
jgi:hypothetical protein